MKRKTGALVWIFAVGMLLFCLALAGYTAARGYLDFRLDDLARSLETSQGRERKQQYEYDQVSEKLPLTREELREAAPLAEAAKEEVNRLKEERKQLRAEKKELEQRQAQAAADSTAPATEETGTEKTEAGTPENPPAPETEQTAADPAAAAGQTPSAEKGGEE